MNATLTLIASVLLTSLSVHAQHFTLGEAQTLPEPKPEKAAWSGLGDHCVVWDEKNRRFLCFFQ